MDNIKQLPVLWNYKPGDAIGEDAKVKQVGDDLVLSFKPVGIAKDPAVLARMVAIAGGLW